ncbi:TPA: ABC transporter permease [Bacillus cereus]|nr:ABC transporter permease [Bacillus cereus]HDR4743802.1 ABC transporter permease [Bacillus cereus]HDR4749647.1 ABC transporter permease [Bacillus cereus]HDR4754959.1 ABC transporter permease [Bacillus cereus]HDR4771934.1 ABC transporter permease [Bacillus cereus]
MSNFKFLTSHIYTEKLKNKMFIITTTLILLIITALVLWPKVQKLINSESSSTKIIVVNQAEENITSFLKDTKTIKYQKLNSDVSSADKKVKDGKADAVLLLKSNASNQLEAELRTEDSLSVSEMSLIAQDLKTSNQLFTIEQMKLNSEQAQKILNSDINLKETNLNNTEKNNQNEELGAIVSYAVGFLIYIFILSYLSMITTDVASEKGTRIMEILISSVSPTTHLLSKIVGILCVGVTQIVIIVAYAFSITYLIGGEYWDVIKDVIEMISISYFIFIILFILLAYVLYLFIGALLGALVTKVEETSQALLPAVMLVMVGFFVMTFGIVDPNNIIVKVFSFIPFTSSMIMPMRMNTTELMLWEPIASISILVITIIILFAVNIRLYHGAVLVYKSSSIFARIKQAKALTKK